MAVRYRVSAGARTGVVAVAVALALVGCNGGAEPGPTSTPTSPVPTVTSAAPTETPTQAPTTPESTETAALDGLPPLPDAAKANTPEGAEAFIRYYFDVANGLYMDPRAGVISEISDPECIACQRTENTISELAASNSRARTEPFLIKSMERIGGGAPGVQRFSMVADAPANATVSADGSESNIGAAATLAGIGAAIWGGSQWKLYDLALEPQ